MPMPRPHTEHLLAPAKINLCLHILGRRADGYHLIESVMAPISLHDELSVTVGSTARTSLIRVSSDSEAAPGDASNLAHRAAALFLARIGAVAEITVTLCKRIPVGSGLGGGSSDAAAVLVALNRIFDRPLRSEELARLGAEIGADVTFFVHGHPARVCGIGEQVEAIPLPVIPLVVCWDRYSLSTKLVYAGVDLSLTTGQPASNIPHSVSGPSWNPERLVNDLELPAARIHPQILALKARLIEAGAQGALMTGSGSAVFGVWSDLGSAQNVAQQLRQDGLWAEAVQTLAASPAVAS
jgi:4-diphosphocytidyl-2-C-methyl-D-erythritol kinase